MCIIKDNTIIQNSKDYYKNDYTILQNIKIEVDL